VGTIQSRINGAKFHQSLTPSIMSGLVDYQASFYKSLALLIKNDPRINTLKDVEKSEFELVFEIKEGSSKVEAKGKEVLSNIVRHWRTRCQANGF
jgi:hypothetical protein